jgi:hypothetical protein
VTGETCLAGRHNRTENRTPVIEKGGLLYLVMRAVENGNTSLLRSVDDAPLYLGSVWTPLRSANSHVAQLSRAEKCVDEKQHPFWGGVSPLNPVQMRAKREAKRRPLTATAAGPLKGQGGLRPQRPLRDIKLGSYQQGVECHSQPLAKQRALRFGRHRGQTKTTDAQTQQGRLRSDGLRKPEAMGWLLRQRSTREDTRAARHPSEATEILGVRTQLK